MYATLSRSTLWGASGVYYKTAENREMFRRHVCIREMHLPAVNASPASIKRAELAADLAAGVEVQLSNAADPALLSNGFRVRIVMIIR